VFSNLLLCRHREQNTPTKQKEKRTKKMMYGNSSNGYGYSPDRSKDKINHDNLNTRFLGAKGNNAVGYYGCTCNTAKKTAGHYDGRGVWVND
jgi:hypothetical protein